MIPAELTLYDDFERTDPEPAGAVESSFAFLNRIDQPFWQRVRDLTETWFAEFPREHSADLRARFRKDDPNQHWPAWWELYLHALFLKLGFEVEVHPDLIECGNHPDFRLSRNGEPVTYVEAVCANTGAIIAPERHTARENRLIDIINEVPPRGFYVALEIESTGPDDLRRKTIKRPVEDWVASAGDDHVSPDLVIDRDGWEIRLSALRGGQRTGAGPLVSMGPMISGMIDDIGAMRMAAARKNGHYPVGDTPLTLAILQKNDPSDEDCVDRLLYGDRIHGGGRVPNSLWGTAAEQARPKPDALIVGRSIHPWNVSKRVPTLFTPPSHESAVSAIELPRSEEGADDIDRACGIFGLPVEWPGPEPKFMGV